MTNDDLNNDVVTETAEERISPAIPGFVMGVSGVTEVMRRALKAPSGSLSKGVVYPQMITLKLQVSKKDPEHAGTAGYIVHADGSLEKLADPVKLVDIQWSEMAGAALVIAYLGLTGTSYRMYGGRKMLELFGVGEDNDSLD